MFEVQKSELILDDFYDNQEWLLTNCKLSQINLVYSASESLEAYSMVTMELELKRQCFYYIFNLVVPTTLVTLVAIIGFHTPGSSSQKRESKFRLGITTLLSMSVMLLMVVNEMPKFALASTPGQRGSFSDVPLLAIFYISLIAVISLASCTTSLFVVVERYALEHPNKSSIPWFIRWLAWDWSLWLRTKKTSSIGNDEAGYAYQEANTWDHSEERNNVQSEVVMQVKGSTCRRKNTDGLQERQKRLKSGSAVPRSLSDSFHIDNTKETVPLAPMDTCSVTQSAAASHSDASDTWKVQLERIADQLSIIANRLVANSNQEAPRANQSKLSKRRLTVTSGTPILTSAWNKIISRLGFISLVFYLSIVFCVIMMFFFPIWY